MNDMVQYFEYLDELRKSDDLNMFSAAPYLAARFDLSQEKSFDILALWMESFSVNISAQERVELLRDTQNE